MKKYLPVGTVCTLKGKTKKVVIIGFCNPEFNGNLKINDYCGCAYPEGLLLPNYICNFNENDIENVDYMGFESDTQRNFNNLLNGVTSEDTKVSVSNDMILVSNETYSKLLFDENGVVMIAEPVVKKEKENKPINKFSNGIIDVDIKNPFHVEYNDIPSNNTTNSNDIFNKIEFDENGVVISDNTNIEEKKNELLNEIKFDENGVVVSVGKEELEKEIPQKKYRFDDNGVLIAIDDFTENEDIPPIGPGLPKYEQPVTNKYEFDENGNVIADAQSNNKSNFKFDENGVVISE